jgi:hypothetical protein
MTGAEDVGRLVERYATDLRLGAAASRRRMADGRDGDRRTLTFSPPSRAQKAGRTVGGCDRVPTRLAT